MVSLIEMESENTSVEESVIFDCSVYVFSVCDLYGARTCVLLVEQGYRLYWLLGYSVVLC